MTVRITNNATNSQLSSQITRLRRRAAVAQEHISSGKRINRPSDDPSGSGAVVRIRTSQTVVGQYQRVVGAVKDRLSVADSALDNYQTTLDRARSLIAKGASASTDANGRAAIATELEGIRARILSAANTRHGDEYVFGGTRQSEPPFDLTTGALSPTPSAAPLTQLEPGTSAVAAGVTAEGVFSDESGTVLQAITDIVAALRGTGDEDADKATVLAGLDRLARFNELAQSGRVRVGVALQAADAAALRLEQGFMAYEAAAENVEGADFVEAALELRNAQQALEAAMQAGTYAGRRTLIDFLG